jgi:hypothetical protein
MFYLNKTQPSPQRMLSSYFPVCIVSMEKRKEIFTNLDSDTV